MNGAVRLGRVVKVKKAGGYISLLTQTVKNAPDCTILAIGPIQLQFT